MLLELTTLMKGSELATIDAHSIRFSSVDVSFSLLKYRKTQRSGSLPHFWVKSLQAGALANASCPVLALCSYLEGTRDKRLDAESRQPLFISVVRPFHRVIGTTVGHWIKVILRAADVGAGFTDHSTRGTEYSRAAAKGILFLYYLRLANWAASPILQPFPIKKCSNLMLVLQFWN